MDQHAQLPGQITRGLGVGERVDLVELSVRRSEGDPELAEVIRQDAEGDWNNRSNLSKPLGFT